MAKLSPQWFLALTVLLLSAAAARAQDTTDYRVTRPELFVTIQDTMTMLRLDETGDTIPRSWFAPAYTFVMSYDSICTINYGFTECRQNNQPINLSRWIWQRRVNARSMLLSFNSTTVPFTCHAGDTLSFYRELHWTDPVHHRSSTNNYYALDTLDFAVELVRMSDSLRAVQLDTLGVLPNTVPDVPRIYGTRSFMARVEYVVPPELDGQQVFMRVLAHHRGPGKYWFTRIDEFTVGLSEGLHDPNLQDFQTNVYGGRYGGKRSLAELSAELTGARLDVTQASGSGDVVIDFPAAPEGRTIVAIYDARGELLFNPDATVGSAGTDRQARYRFDKSGVYFITLIHNGQLIATRKITITL